MLYTNKFIAKLILGLSCFIHVTLVYSTCYVIRASDGKSRTQRCTETEKIDSSAQKLDLHELSNNYFYSTNFIKVSNSNNCNYKETDVKYLEKKIINLKEIFNNLEKKLNYDTKKNQYNKSVSRVECKINGNWYHYNSPECKNNQLPSINSSYRKECDGYNCFSSAYVYSCADLEANTKRLIKEINSLEEQINSLEEQINSLEKHIKNLEEIEIRVNECNNSCIDNCKYYIGNGEDICIDDCKNNCVYNP